MERGDQELSMLTFGAGWLASQDELSELEDGLEMAPTMNPTSELQKGVPRDRGAAKEASSLNIKGFAQNIP